MKRSGNEGKWQPHRIRVMVFNAIFNNISVIFYFIGGGNREYPNKTTELLQFIDHLYHMMLRWILLDMSVIRSSNFICDRYWLHMWLYIQLPYDRDHDGPYIVVQYRFNSWNICTNTDCFMSDTHIRDVYEMTKYYDIVGTITKLNIKTV